MEKQVKSVNQTKLAKLMNVNVVTVKRWRRDFGMPCLKHSSSNEIYFFKEDVLKWAYEKRIYLFRALQNAFEIWEMK